MHEQEGEADSQGREQAQLPENRKTAQAKDGKNAPTDVRAANRPMALISRDA